MCLFVWYVIYTKQLKGTLAPFVWTVLHVSEVRGPNKYYIVMTIALHKSTNITNNYTNQSVFSISTCIIRLMQGNPNTTDGSYLHTYFIHTCML